MKAKVLIAGGSGLIGRRLTQHLIKEGYAVNWLTSSGKAESGVTSFKWNYERGEIDMNSLNDVDYVFNFAGVGVIDKPWTEAYQQQIIESRTGTAKLLFDSLQKTGKKIKAYLSSSAIGYYGNCANDRVPETHAPANDFLGTTCTQWEKAASQFADAGIRTCIVRIGIVLAQEGGAFPELLKAIKFGFAGYLGNGKQYYAWIHIDDLCREFMYLMENDSLNGVYNGVAPNPLPNKELVKQISLVKSGRAILIPVPSFALGLIMGKRKQTVLDSCKVSSEKIQKAGFKFKYAELKEAVEELMKKNISH